MRLGGTMALAGMVLLLTVAAAAVSPSATAPPRVAATIFPVYDIVRQVADRGRRRAGAPARGQPYTFEPTPATVRALSGASLIFVVGHGLDDWAARLARGAGVPRLVAVDAGIRLRRVNDGPGGSVDPHYWLSASNGKLMLGVGSVLAGLGASYRLDVPSGPAVVAIAGIVFLAAWARVAWQARGGSERTSA